MDWKIVFVELLFAAGFLGHVLKVANDDVQKTMFPNLLAWFKVFRINVLVRLGIGLTLWGLYASTPALFVQLLGYFHINFAYSVPATKIVSALVGFCADSLMDLGTQKIPWLGRLIPSAYIAPEVKAQQAALAKKDVQP